eukprot:TRINITY_DN215_c0_g1_i1.p1 TRINITY_DN215_c0_g1~~TRINITY_DN215_c0_g1_i1.p1  ORF type:complete len:304 (+),score=91.19 TRINITY_DN215_c0_g1_i1:256-1167(+)
MMYTGDDPQRFSEDEDEISSVNSDDVPASERQSLPSGCVVEDYGRDTDPNTSYRRTMEDADVIDCPMSGRPEWAFFGIFDGHGGRTASDKAAELVPKYFKRAIESDEVGASREEAFQNAHAKTDEYCCTFHEEFSLIGTTSAVCFLERMPDGRRFLTAANAGDSRVVLSGASRRNALRLTRDHKGTDEDEVARIRKLDGFVLHGRVNALLSVTRAIGDCALKPWVTSAPDIRKEELRSDDDIIIIACDGLWDVVSDDDATRLCREKRDARYTATDCARLLVQKALREGSSDNVSVIVVFLPRE